ncbi:hypothetical protein IFM89_008670 [Coptis chinensis]|uniref:SWIM-type domain-containing protein n=1 Tax=Coptis chinensis TaxID=261450 RepID=A0A835GYI2_9MAGN|nr:hypothetical protein IFM89_008670 [Coptis chinensis]
MIEDIPNWDLEASNSSLYYIRDVKSDYRYTVNIVDQECSCRRWQLFGIVCMHVVVILYKMKADWREYCSSYFCVSTYRMAYKGHIKPMEDPRDWPKPATFLSERSDKGPRNHLFVLVSRESTKMQLVLHQNSYTIHLHTPGVLGGQERIEGEMKMRKHQTRREGSVGCVGQRGIIPRHAKASLHNQKKQVQSCHESPLPLHLHNPKTRSKSRVASSSQPPPASPSSQPSQVPSTRSKSKVATESQPPPASPSSQPSQVPNTRSKSKVATESQPPASPSQPSTRRKSICASSNQVPTSPSSQPNTRSKSKAASSSQATTKPSIVNFQPPTPKQLQTLAAGGVPLPQKPHKANTFQASEQRHTFPNLMKRLRDTYMPPRVRETKQIAQCTTKMAKATKQNKPPLAPPPNPKIKAKFQTVEVDWKLNSGRRVIVIWVPLLFWMVGNSAILLHFGHNDLFCYFGLFCGWYLDNVWFWT